MAPSCKRKSMLSLSPIKAISHKKRSSIPKVANTNAVSAIPKMHLPQPYINRVPRPARWRKAASKSEANQAIKQSIYKPLSEDAMVDQHDRQEQQPGSVELRFSFALPVHDDMSTTRTLSRTNSVQQRSSSRRPDPSLNHSFSNLSFDKGDQTRVITARTRSTTTANAPVLPVVPELTKPKKQREGYGFSYSESMFYDSDEYPDTECDWDSGTERDPGSGDECAPTSNKTPKASEQDRSFADVVVVRDVGSFHIAKPQKRLPCTTATREDTIRLKHAARSLFMYEESADIYGELVSRLERMVYASLQKPHSATASPAACALKLCNFLLRTKEERVETGEDRRFLEHELEWARWLVDASRSGVMHLKGLGCECRPDWEED